MRGVMVLLVSVSLSVCQLPAMATSTQKRQVLEQQNEAYGWMAELIDEKRSSQSYGNGAIFKKVEPILLTYMCGQRY